MNFMFSWQEQYLTRSLRSLVRYCSCHSNMKFISSRHRVIFSIYHSYLRPYPVCEVMYPPWLIWRLSQPQLCHRKLQLYESPLNPWSDATPNSLIFVTKAAVWCWRRKVQTYIELNDDFDLKFAFYLFILQFSSKSLIFRWVAKQYRNVYLLSST